MPLNFNGTAMKKVNSNGTAMKKANANGVQVWVAESVLDNINLKTESTTGEGNEKYATSSWLNTNGLTNAKITGTFSATVTTQRSYNFIAILRLYGYNGTSSTKITDIVWEQTNSNYSTSVNQTVSVSGYSSVYVQVIVVASTTNPTLAYGQFSNGKIIIT